ncbi:DinB family protein [Filibacter tadaridae]|uniref:DinB superfamily protein n=1 Tax=Filibacter tadaridae TaxID=2483811 RepID=A0A3P5XB94_9BACL|nr:DinB family protein [Filibacter tadaridae]VDC32036.1 DinB superfamily protein [Filibacter tadaridae]
MKSEQMHNYFIKLKQQRDVFYNDDNLNFENAWKRPMPEKWSIGETLYHLVLMVRVFRGFSRIYVPIMLPLAYVQKKKPYKKEIHDIYQEYRYKKKRSMNAPFLIKPPSGLERKWTFNDIQALLEYETDKLATNLNDIDQDLAGQIYFPDPVAMYPNLIQCVHLLAIHEQHHFNITKKYYLT